MYQGGGQLAKVSAIIERKVAASVLTHLRKELDARDLLLASDTFRQAEAEVGRRGESLLVHFIACWSGVRLDSGVEVSLQFRSADMRERIQAALAFGAVVATVLAPEPRRVNHSFARIELLCAIFNLGIGLVDNLCDDDAGVGLALLDLLNREELMACAAEARDRGWLRMALPAALAGNGAVGFAADLIEIFFEELHGAFRDERSSDLRREIGGQLAAALAAERDSVGWLRATTEHERSQQSSRLTSVLPFQIIETLACGTTTTDGRRAGTLLGEAMWRIDDLLDLGQDARGGALNSVLLRAFTEAAAPRPGCEVEAAIEGLLTSSAIAEIAAEAADSLADGLAAAGPPVSHLQRNAIAQFLYFIQSYAGMEPE